MKRRRTLVGGFVLAALSILCVSVAAAEPPPALDRVALAMQVDDAGQPRIAEALLRQALDEQRASGGEMGLRAAALYSALALNLDAQGREADAEPLLRQALAAIVGSVGDRHAATGAAYVRLADCLSASGRIGEAEKLARKGLAIAQANEPQAGPAVAAASRALARVFDASDRRAKAEPLWRAALAADRSALGERDVALAEDLAGLAGALAGLGRYAEAEPLYRQALDIRRALSGSDHYSVAADTADLAALLNQQGRPLEAEPLLRRALEVVRSAFGDESRRAAATYGLAADNLQLQGRFAAAEPLYRKALEIERATLGDARGETADAWGALGANLDAQGRHAEAEPLLRKALAVRRALSGRGEAVALAYAGLAANLAAQGRLDEAEKLDRRSLGLIRASLGEQHPRTALAYASLAGDLNRQKRYAAAEPLFRTALETLRATLGEQHKDTARAYDALAQNLHLQAAHAQAEALSTRAVAIVREQRNEAMAVAGDGPDAALRRARAGDERDASDARIYANNLQLAWMAAKANPANLAKLRGEAFVNAQNLSISAAAQALAQNAARAAGPGGDDLARRRESLSGEARRLEAQLVGALPNGDASRARQLRRDLDAVGRALAAIDAQLRRSNPRYDELISPPPLTLTQVQKRLRVGEGLLLIAQAGADIHVFAVSREKIAWNRVEGGAAEVERRVRLLRCQVEDDGCGPSATPGAFDLNTAYGLYRDLLQPVEPVLANADRLFVTTSGSLATLPLGMLTTAAPRGSGPTIPWQADPVPDRAEQARALAAAPWLADRYALTTLPSVANLRVQAPDAGWGSRWAFLGFGDPALGATALTPRRRGPALADPKALRDAFAPIPGTRVELRAMAQALGAGAGSLRMGAAATETAVKTSPNLAQARVVNFATHGLLSNEIAGIDEPGLVFTPPKVPSAEDDGVLTASEAAQLKLRADWVILSACNTAGADGGPGADSLSGLARAFLYAGAKALLASQWHVFDASTAALAVETLIIQRANPRLSKAQALQQAMLVVRTGRRPDGSQLAGWSADWAHPAYWAPFVLISSGG